MKLLSFHAFGEANGAPRIFIESSRLAALGFSPGVSLLASVTNRSLVIRPGVGGNTVSREDSWAGGSNTRVQIDRQSTRRVPTPMNQVTKHGAIPPSRAFFVSNNGSK